MPAAPPPPDATDTPGPDADPTPGRGPVPGPDLAGQAGPRRQQVALRLLGELLELPPEGLELGRDAPRCAGVPGLSELLGVSRHHARLSWRGRVPFVEDLGSLNGTFVDGEAVVEPRPLLPGQTLRLGRDVEVEVVELEFDQDGIPL
jgi:FHA domain